jgi:hypothetical protein
VKASLQTLRTILETTCRKYDLDQCDLTVLSSRVDPYRLDTPANHRDGAWAGEQLERFYPRNKQTHWRGLHYSVVMSKKKVLKPDGVAYRNSEEDWLWLSERAGKAARWLGYIKFDRIVDRRNAEPIIHRKASVTPESFLSIGLDIAIPDADDINPTPIARGFSARQAYHFVIFGEKSSLEEVLLPVAEEECADLYLPTGEISDALIWRIARDAAEDGRPLVVFTVSDCDPAGYQMPVSIGRKLQAFCDLQFPKLRGRWELVSAALTPEQARAEGLPETPLKEGEKRASRWRESFDIEQTEVDALTTPEMIRRGVLRRIMKEAFDRYVDRTLDDRVRQAHKKWNADAQAALDEQIDQDAISAIREEAADRLDELQAEIARINEQLELSTTDFELPPIDVPGPEVDLDDGRQALLRFGDDWITATRKLKARKSYGNGDDQ